MLDHKVRIGFVGVGAMGQCAHLRNYVLLPECEVVAIAEIRPKLAQAVATRYGIAKVYGHYDEMLNSEKLDGLVASQPYTRHGLLVTELAKAGLPILTEKPLAGTIEAGERIVEALRRHNTWEMVGYHKRSDPATMYAKAETDRLRISGEIGKLRYVRVTMPEGDWIQGGFDGLIRTDDPMPDLEMDPPPAGMDPKTFKIYDQFVNYYIHQINLVRHLLGEPYEVTYATDTLLAGRSESGVSCIIELSPYKTTVDWQESALVGFDNGYVRLDLPAPLAANRPGRVEILRDPGGRTPVVETPHLPWVHAMRQQAVNFVRAIKGEIEPLTGAEEALEDLRLARRYVSLLTGR